jgi:hypothetical protein
LNQPTISNGRSYQASPGSFLDVPDFDAVAPEASGWTFVAVSGPTTGRPTSGIGTPPLTQGQCFYDTTLSVELISGGSSWRRRRRGAH